MKVWSPYPREKYTVTLPDGELAGIGALDIFEGHPGLWNLVWLHSVRVDTLLNWDAPPEEAPAYSKAIKKCEESAYMVVGAFTVEYAAANMGPRGFVMYLKENNAKLPIQAYWDLMENDSWESLVNDRMKLSKLYFEKKGNLFTANFG